VLNGDPNCPKVTIADADALNKLDSMVMQVMSKVDARFTADRISTSGPGQPAVIVSDRGEP